jgi:hypothetical protein
LRTIIVKANFPAFMESIPGSEEDRIWIMIC